MHRKKKVKSVKKYLDTVKRYLRWTKKKRNAILFLFALVEFYIILLWPTLACLNICEPDYYSGFLQGIIMLPYVIITLFIVYVIFGVLAEKKLERFYDLNLKKVALFGVLYAVAISLTESYIRNLVYFGFVDRYPIPGFEGLASILYLPSWYIASMMALFIAVPILIFFAACLILFKRR
jgi:hypothetical protein